MTLAARPLPQADPTGRLPVFPHDPQNRKLFSACFDHQPFSFSHSLHTMEIFSMPALLRLAEKCMHNRQYKSHYETGEPQVNGCFGHKPAEMTLVEALENIATGKNWIILKRIHEEPEYRAALADFVWELSDLTGIDLRHHYHDPILTIFITSPNRITPYHLDGEANFLAQVQGEKSVFLYDSNDPFILTHEEMERYWTGNFLNPSWHEELADGQWRYEVSPGMGVFNPATFPHWVKNGNNVSVSVSINFKRIRNPRIGAYRANYFLRKAGFAPTPPGVSPTLDQMKDVTFGKAYEGVHWVRHRVRLKLGI